jgi:hypothetical protein
MCDRVRSLVVVLLVVVLLVPSGGCCTLIGAGIGATVDAHRPPSPVPPERWNHLEPGRRVEILRRDGTRTFEWPGADSTLRSVPREEISLVSANPWGHPGLAIGILAGLALDVTVLVVLRSNYGYQAGGYY